MAARPHERTGTATCSCTAKNPASLAHERHRMPLSSVLRSHRPDMDYPIHQRRQKRQAQQTDIAGFSQNKQASKTTTRMIEVKTTYLLPSEKRESKKPAAHHTTGKMKGKNTRCSSEITWLLLYFLRGFSLVVNGLTKITCFFCNSVNDGI